MFRNGKLLGSSRSVYADAVKSYFRFIVINKYDESFNINYISEWLSGISNYNTYNIRLQGIKEFYYKAFENHSDTDRLKMREAFESIRRKLPAQAKLHNIHYLKSKQVFSLCKRVSPRMALIIEALFWTGCRISELTNIRINECRIDDVVTIAVLGKGSEYGYVYMPVYLYNKIIDTFHGKEFLFETAHRTSLNRVCVYAEMRRQSIKHFGIKVNPHMLRHSKAMYLLLEKKMSIDKIAKAMRHKRFNTTATYYLHDDPDARAQGIPITNKIKRGA